MSDQFALGLLAQIVEKLQQEVDALTMRVETLEDQVASLIEPEEGGRYLDGKPF